jgi:hypothetical protein
MEKRLERIREDLQTQITDVFPSEGTVLFVHPKHNVQFNPQYCDWLADTMKEILPFGVKGVVLSENVTSFDVLRPRDDDPEYIRGWYDALQSVQDAHA